MTHPVTLVIADDHPLFRAGLREAIVPDPAIHIVGEAGDGETALSLIRQHSPAMAVLDIDMPKMSGLEVARQLQKEKNETDVIFLTTCSTKQWMSAHGRTC
jgi:DNA-binding NarL/FixJ family response regulator